MTSIGIPLCHGSPRFFESFPEISDHNEATHITSQDLLLGLAASTTLHEIELRIHFISTIDGKFNLWVLIQATEVKLSHTAWLKKMRSRVSCFTLSAIRCTAWTIVEPLPILHVVLHRHVARQLLSLLRLGHHGGGLAARAWSLSDCARPGNSMWELERSQLFPPRPRLRPLPPPSGARTCP